MPQKYITSECSPQNGYGGCDVIIDILRRKGMRGFIDGTLKNFGKERAPRAEYEYSEGILSWFVTLCCGGESLKNMHSSRDMLFSHPRLYNLPPRYTTGMSPDTFSKMCDELLWTTTRPKKKSHETKSVKKRKKKRGRPSKKELEKRLFIKSAFSEHEINDNTPLNKLLIRSCIKLGLIKKRYEYTLDLDVTVLLSKNRDARKYYDGNGKTAYCPLMASINDIPVYIENRNGDTPSSWNITETVDKIVKALQEEGITIRTVRMDGAAYVEEFIEYANKHNLYYVTRVRKDRGAKVAKDLIDWEIEQMRGTEVELSEKGFWKGGSMQRIIVKHVIKEDTYWALITNIRDLNKKEICDFYSMRSGVSGFGEHIFKSLKKSFRWKNLPFRTLAKNEVYLIISAICYIIFKFILRILHRIWPMKFTTKITLRTLFIKFICGKTEWREGALLLRGEIAAMYARLSGFT